MFWTANTIEGPVTLCERCALRATNAGSEDSPLVNKPFGSMNEFMVTVAAMEAVACIPAEDSPLSRISSSETGACGNCESAA